MKLNILLALVVVAMGYVTCKNLKKPAETQAQVPYTDPNTFNNSGYEWKSAHVSDYNADTAGIKQIKGTPRLVQVPVEKIAPPSTSRKAYMTEGDWHFVGAFQPSDSTVFQQYQNKWLRFKGDQTFDIMNEQKKVRDSGRWAYDEENYVLYLSCRDPYINNTWAVKERGWVMVWRGNTDLNITGIQARIECNRGTGH